MARRLPPAPKERAASLAVSGAPRQVSSPLPAAPPSVSEPKRRHGDMAGFVVFATLILIGLLASARAFLVM